MKSLLSLLFVFLVSNMLFGQATLEDELESIAQKLVSQLNANDKVNRVAIADFAYRSEPLTRIGKHFADELAVSLMQNVPNFSITDRKVTREALYGPKVEQKTSTAELQRVAAYGADVASNDATETNQEKKIDIANTAAAALSIIKFGGKKLKDTYAIISGDIEDMGDYLQVNVRVNKNSSNGDMLGAARGKVIKTPDIIGLLDGKVAAPQQPVVVSSPGLITTPTSTPIGTTVKGGAITFKHQNLEFEVIGCTQNNRDVECRLNIVASETDVNLGTFNATRILDANGGHEFKVSEMKLSDAATTGDHVAKTLVAGYPIEAVFRFKNVNREIASIARLEIHAGLPYYYGFVARLDNIPVSR